MNVWLAGKRISVKPGAAIGKGGEADVFDLADGRVLKLFKAPDHPDYQGLPAEQQGAAARLDEHQRKLPAFPKGLPPSVVGPEELALEQKGAGRIVGYAMRRVSPAEPLFRLADPAFRRAGFTGGQVVHAFTRLWSAVEGLHRQGVVLGDFNDRNVLLTGAEPWLIDADSFQYAGFLCPVFTDRFVDPLLCDAGQSGPVQARPHVVDSDWYAFAVLLMQSLLFVGPYGGIHRPKDPSRRVAQAARPLHRITVFHPEVQYPKPAASPKTLPDDLLARLSAIFEHDQRGAFPLPLVEGLRFERCASCGIEHARAACPTCRPSATASVQTATRVRGGVCCHHVFETRGVILAARVDREPAWLFHEQGAYRREDGSVVLRGELDPRLRFELRGRDTLVGRTGELGIVRPGTSPVRVLADRFATDGRRLFWTHDGQLLREGDVQLGTAAPQRVGEVLSGQTRFFVGPAFGIGLYRAGNLSVGFVFENDRGGLNDQVRLPQLTGELLDATATLDDRRAWLRLRLASNGRTRHLCVVVSRTGAVEAVAEAPAGDASWLGTLGGACAVGGVLLAATDAGLVRVEVQGKGLAVTREFLDTEPFVSSDDRLLVGRQGLYVVQARSVSLLQMP